MRNVLPFACALAFQAAFISARPITVGDLMGVKHVGGLSLSPDGRWVAYTVRKADAANNLNAISLFVASSTTSGSTVSLGPVGPAIYTQVYFPAQVDPVWSPDSRYVFYVMPEAPVNGGLGRRQVFRWPREGGIPVQFSRSDEDVLYALVDDNGDVLYSKPSPRPDPVAQRQRYFDRGIWFFDLDSAYNTDTRSGGGSFNYSDRSLSLASSWRAPNILDQAVDNMRRKPEPATGVTVPGGSYSIYVITDGRERLATARETERYEALVKRRRNIVSSEPAPDHPSRVWLERPTGAISYEYRAHYGDHPDAPRALKGHRHVFAVSRTDPQGTQVSPSLEYSFSQCSYQEAARRFACLREDPEHPPEIVTFQDTGEREVVLTNLNPQVKEWSFPKMELIEWTDSLGNPGYGFLYKPIDFKEGVRYPTIILPYYDAPYSFNGASVVANEYPTYAFTSRGFAVLRPDTLFYARKLYKNADVLPSLTQKVFEGNLAIVLAGVEALVDKGVADKNRLGIGGLSYGARMVSYNISHTNLFKAASLPTIAPSEDAMWMYYAQSQSIHDLMSHDEQGKVVHSTELARSKEAAVTRWAGSVNTPLLVDASDSEMAGSVEAVVALRERGKPVEFIVFPDAMHFKKWPRQIASVWQLNVDWFDFWLRGYTDPDPEKAEQYERWKKLKAR
jgi:dipeptidyl aminopeptidase/acylaminoacyl peptidase